MIIERNGFVFKCRHKSKFRLSWLGATEARTLGNSRDIDAGWFLLELITFNPVVDRIICKKLKKRLHALEADIITIKKH